MNELTVEVVLDSAGRHRLKTVKFFDRGLVDFVVVYYVVENSSNVPLVSFDFAHGFFHRDLRYLPDDDGRKKRRLPAAKSLKDLYDFSVADVHKNWKRYYLDYLGRSH